MSAPRNHLANKLAELGFHFHEQTPNSMVYRRGEQRVYVRRKKRLADDEARSILRQVGCADREIDDFLRQSHG